MERRIREWAVGWNDVGRAVLEWKEASPHVKLRDPEATWADLDVSALSLEDESASAAGFNPYDRCPAWMLERKRIRIR
jgi:hypothetical protein